MICTMLPADLDSVVRVHLAAFKDFFLSSLGASFLKEFYEAALCSESGIAFTSRRDNVVCGFAVGTTQPRGFYRSLFLRRWHRFLLASAIPVLKNPRSVLSLLRRLSAVSADNYPPSEALLMSVAVSPNWQGQGMGSELIDEFLMRAKQKGAASVSLTTDKLNNDRVNQFYVQSGFDCIRSFTTSEARRMNEYRKYL